MRAALARWIVPVAVVVAAAGCRQLVVPSTTEVRAVRLERDPTSRSFREARVVAEARSLALATTADDVLYGSMTEDALFTAPKRGGAPVKLADRAPLDVAASEDLVAWIALPGDVLYRVRRGAAADLVLARGTFRAVAIEGPDVFVVEVHRRGGGLRRVRGSTSSWLASFREPPRDLTADPSAVYVVTGSELRRVSRGDDPSGRRLATGDDLWGIAATDDLVFTTAQTPAGRVLWGLRKDRPGPAVEIARGVHRGPIASWGAHVYFLDEDRQSLWRVPADGGERELVARSPDLVFSLAMTVDESGVYVALDGPDEARVLAISHEIAAAERAPRS